MAHAWWAQPWLQLPLSGDREWEVSNWQVHKAPHHWGEWSVHEVDSQTLPLATCERRTSVLPILRHEESPYMDILSHTDSCTNITCSMRSSRAACAWAINQLTFVHWQGAMEVLEIPIGPPMRRRRRWTSTERPTTINRSIMFHINRHQHKRAQHHWWILLAHLPIRMQHQQMQPHCVQQRQLCILPLKLAHQLKILLFNNAQWDLASQCIHSRQHVCTDGTLLKCPRRSVDVMANAAYPWRACTSAGSVCVGQSVEHVIAREWCRSTWAEAHGPLGSFLRHTASMHSPNILHYVATQKFPVKSLSDAWTRVHEQQRMQPPPPAQCMPT